MEIAKKVKRKVFPYQISEQIGKDFHDYCVDNMLSKGRVVEYLFSQYLENSKNKEGEEFI